MTQNQLTYWANVEKERANRAQEELKRSELDEAARHNVTSEGFTNRTVEETVRSNLAKERETAIHNRASEDLTKYAADVSASASRYSADQGRAGRVQAAGISADASKYSADVRSGDSRYATDVQAGSKKYETDVKSWDTKQQQQIDKQKIAEVERSNKAQEAIQWTDEARKLGNDIVRIVQDARKQASEFLSW